MSEIIHQETVSPLKIAQASSGNIVVSQKSINDDATSIAVERAALPALIAALQDYGTRSRS